MARARPRHQAQRAIADLTVKAIKATKDRDAWRDQLGLQENDQQIQLAFSGSGGPTPGFVTIDVDFDFPFHYAPGQRDSDLEHPHFNFGVEVDGDVMITVAVKDWTIDASNGAYTGATILIGALGTDTATAFTGSAHLTFQGMSAADEIETTELES